ncbi:hypothetical protein W59_15091 [Rhodococcus opacus RKJ300 = JCM 13270]|uniref:Uncharacterized protein n=1 Tax=Rhodococcus opacus RKJ300 = JCM 13270 TaxID=1165867 RepID=I0WRV2_RHOOP|nr:hypothetical protein W59_15091 [Rhodococcus opacus RKJ300 = JCM 13270]
MDRRTAGIVLDIFAVQACVAALYAHPMLCLVESTVTDYPEVGGRPVYFGSVWDLGPDPPAPFHDGDLVENVSKIYADEATASQYVAALHQSLPTPSQPSAAGRSSIPCWPPSAPQRFTPSIDRHHLRRELDCGRSSLVSEVPGTTPSSATNSCTSSRTPECISIN